jgi:hypothetical protein
MKGLAVETKDALLLILPVLSGILGSYFTYFFAVRSRRQEAILRFKEEKYSALLVLLQGFVGVTASANTKRQFFEEQYRSWIYSSDEVVKSINQLIKLVVDSRGQQPNLHAGRQAVGNIVLAMRKDLLGKTNLSFDDFLYTDVH